MSLQTNISPPKKAILLAAGFGTRMQPLSFDRPKPMMPLWNKPLVFHIIDMLASWGVTDILVNLHQDPNCIINAIRNRSVSSPRIQFSFEPAILGTGGLLKRASWFLDKNPFWMANTDIAADLSPDPFLSAFKQNPLAALWMHSDLGPRTVEIKNKTVTDFRSSAPGSPNTFTFCGIHLISPAIMNFLPENDFFSIVDAYELGMKKGETVRGVVQPNSFWRDLGTPDRYIGAHRDILQSYLNNTSGGNLLERKQIERIKRFKKKGVQIDGFAAIGENVSIAPGACIRDSVLWDGSVIRRNVHIKDTILSRNVQLNIDTESSAGVLCSTIPENKNFRQVLRKLGWTPEKSVALALEKRGSNRFFIRLQRGRKSVILIKYDNVRKENTRYVSHARFLLRKGVSVPKVIFDMPFKRLTVMEDVGTKCLKDCVADLTEKKILNHYKRVIDQLLILHSIPLKSISPKRLEPPFSTALYKWEHGLFADHFLTGYLQLDKRVIFNIKRELSNLTRKLSFSSNVLVHRDMQSSNILLRKGKPVFIDFQGLRQGPAAYDLASLLCDPYVMLNEGMQQRLLDYYLELSPDPDSVSSVFWQTAVQRLSQALGAYGRLSAIPQMQHFEEYIIPGAKMMLRALAHLDGMHQLKNVIQNIIDEE